MALIDDLIAAALAAGSDIMKVYATDFTVEAKADLSPVTEADLRAEKIIADALARCAPHIPVVAEESVAAGSVPPPSETFFLVDPLDGSKEFIARNGEFTVNIALVNKGEPVLGVVYAPALGRIWWGGGEGAHAAAIAGEALGDRLPIRCARGAGKGCRVLASRSHGSPELDRWLEAIEVAERVAAGSSVKFCLLAEGRADLYPRFGRTMEWDTAAGDAILRAAGGAVTTLDGVPLAYGKRGRKGEDDFANPHFIARGAIG